MAGRSLASFGSWTARHHSGSQFTTHNRGFCNDRELAIENVSWFPYDIVSTQLSLGQGVDMVHFHACQVIIPWHGMLSNKLSALTPDDVSIATQTTHTFNIFLTIIQVIHYVAFVLLNQILVGCC